MNGWIGIYLLQTLVSLMVFGLPSLGLWFLGYGKIGILLFFLMCPPILGVVSCCKFLIKLNFLFLQGMRPSGKQLDTRPSVLDIAWKLPPEGSMHEDQCGWVLYFFHWELCVWRTSSGPCWTFGSWLLFQSRLAHVMLCGQSCGASLRRGICLA